jgi:transcriptional regulator with XRE-family HTH domain
MHRRRAALSQGELAFLLGSTGNNVARYERGAAIPMLTILLAYGIIFGTPVDELFGGVLEEVERDVIARAEALAGELQSVKLDNRTARKLELLRAIVFGPEISAENP